MKLAPSDDGFTIDAADLGAVLDLPPAEVQQMMRRGEVTSRFERGEGEHAGRFRLTFLHGSRRVQLVVDAEGRVLQRSRTRIAPPPG